LTFLPSIPVSISESQLIYLYFKRHQKKIAAFVFVPFVFWGEFTTALAGGAHTDEFVMILAETPCWEMEKIAKFLIRNFLATLPSSMLFAYGY
jgi:hypothetical protein